MTVTSLATATAAGWVDERGCSATTSAVGDYTMVKAQDSHVLASGVYTTAGSGVGRLAVRVHEYATTQAQLFTQINDYELEQAAKNPS
jgi:hypothetical protein